jgi:hypothetical protein
VNDDNEHTRTNIHALSGIRTHGLSVQAIKAHASHHGASGTGCVHKVVKPGSDIRIIVVLVGTSRKQHFSLQNVIIFLSKQHGF